MSIPNRKFHLFDSWARKGLTEIMTVDTLIGSELSLLSDIKHDWDNMDDEEKLRSMFQTLECLGTLAHAANYRAQQYIISILVTNKLLFRDHILNNCQGSSYSKSVWRATGFASNGVFGDIPESFRKLLEGSSHNEYLLKVKKGFTKGAPVRVGVDQPSSHPYKRFKTDLGGFTKFSQGRQGSGERSSQKPAQQFFRKDNSSSAQGKKPYQSNRKK